MQLYISDINATVQVYFRLFFTVLQEGVCILTGLGYKGVVEGKHQWDACANMKVWLYETTPRFQGTIDSFNINTNEWAARSVPSWKSVLFPDSYSKCCPKG